MRGCQQALHHLAVFQVRLHNFFHIVQVHVAVPNTFGVNHGHWPGSTAVQAAGLVDPYVSHFGNARRFDQ